MKIRVGPITAEVMSTEDIAASGALVMAVSVKDSLRPWEHYYPSGTKAGYACSLCNQDCILAPSGQQLIALGKNRVVCMDCMLTSLKPAN